MFLTYKYYYTVYYHDSGMKVEILEIAARDNMKKSLLITPVPLSLGSQLEWVGFNVVSGKFSSIFH